jgi:hypothetical protein
MKKSLTTLVAVFLLVFLASAQEDGWTTYYAENVGFKIDFPDDWASSLVEEKKLGFYGAAGVSSLENDQFTRIVVLLSGVYQAKVTRGFKPNIKSDLNWYQKRQEKTAKKENDSKYEYLERNIEEEFREKTMIGWHDFIHTRTSESGEKYLVKERQVFIYFISTPRYRITINFSSRIDDWEEAEVYFQKILDSFERYEV